MRYFRVELKRTFSITKTHLILKYFEGETLTKRLKSTGPLGEEKTRELVQNIAQALKYCHEIGVSHRDIKSDNVLINQDNHIVLIDFAFSFCSLSGKKAETYCGTISYMSPELISKQPHCPKKADVWALGILAYKIVTGEHPFQCSVCGYIATHDQEAIEKRILTEDYSQDKAEGFSRSFNNFLGRTLEKCPEKRSTIKEVIFDDVATSGLVDKVILKAIIERILSI
jgi:serine/threonine protein kinase